MRIIFLVVLFTGLLIGCKQHSPEVEALEDKVMEIHDAVMPEMGTIHKLRKALKKKLKDENLEETTANIFETAILDLENADEGMMSWMAEYKLKDTDPTAQLEYLQKEKIKIAKVKVDMETAIKNAKSLIE